MGNTVGTGAGAELRPANEWSRQNPCQLQPLCAFINPSQQTLTRALEANQNRRQTKILPMKQLQARFVKIEDSFRSHHTARVKMILTNKSNQDLSVLTWNTPLDRLVTDCLEVTVDGKTIEYDGPVVKRGAPTPDDYIVIKAGQSVETEFPVSDAYDTSKPGTYHVKLKNPLPDVAPKQTHRGLAAAMKTGERQPVEQAVPAKVSFKIKKGEGAHATLGALARGEEKVRASLAKATASPARAAAKKKSAGTPLAAQTTGGTAAQRSAALRAHGDGYKLCIAALAGLAHDARYVEWFGAFTQTRLNKVKAHYTAVKVRMETVTFTYNLTGSGCTSGVYAYTYKGTSTIWFCDAFWDAPATGTDSKAGTVVHEHTHSDAMTDDIQYGQPGCRTLASNAPEKAINNADSHEYYAKG
jgi:peptidyl-Lys metalloendopeptidase